MTVTITGGTAASSPGSTTLADAREILELTTRLPGSETSAGTNNLKRVDYAIRAAGEEFVRRTRCTRKTNDSLTLTADSRNFSTGSIADFHPSRLINIEVEHPTEGTIYPADNFNYRHVRSESLHGISYHIWQNAHPDTRPGGTPDRFAWRDDNNAIVDPEPDVAWKVRLVYWAPFTSWTIGTASPGGVTLNIPDHLIIPVIEHGARAYLQSAVNPRQAAFGRELFEQHINATRGTRSLSNVTRPNPWDYR